MGKVANIVRNPFAFLFARSQKEDLVAEHVIREHHRGRSLADILTDAYVTNRLTPDKFDRILDRPEVLQAFGDDIVAQQRAAAGDG